MTPRVIYFLFTPNGQAGPIGQIVIPAPRFLRRAWEMEAYCFA
jgi:hypothetical protein